MDNYTPRLETLEARNLMTVFKVGPGQEFAEIWKVPWGSLVAGDQVQVYWQAQPYHSKIDINTSGIAIIGMAGPDGQRPIIDGNGAQEDHDAQYFIHDIATEGVITVAPAKFGGYINNVLIQGLELKNANENSFFYDAHGRFNWYWNAAAGVAIYMAADVTVDNCDIHDNDNGIFGKSYGWGGGDLYNVKVTNNHIWGNGMVGSAGRHNTYIEGWYTRYVGNRYGPLRDGATGMNLKDRSVRPVIAFNYLEGGARVLELVDPDDGASDMVDNNPEFGTEWVYGNVLINNGQGRGVVHFGWDQLPEDSQKVLYFYNNTVITENTYPDQWYYTELLKLNKATAYVFDNVVSLYSPTGGWPGFFFLAVTEYGPSTVYYGVNVAPVGAYADDVDVVGIGILNLIFAEAGLVNQAGGDFRLTDDSPAVGKAAGFFDGLLFHSLQSAGLPNVDWQPAFKNGTFSGWVPRHKVDNLGAWENDDLLS
jgi:hypothetical protein